MESEKDWDSTKQKFSLNRKNAGLYAATLIANGDIDKLEPFLDLAIMKYPDEADLMNARKQVDFYKEKPRTQIAGLSLEEKSQLKLQELFPAYLAYKAKADTETTKLIEVNIMELLEQVGNRLIYFPGQIEYLLALENLDLYERIRSSAESIIAAHRLKLFPNTVDNYELALAYRALAILSEKADDRSGAESYSKLAYEQILKMRSFWIEEDIVVYRRILKITSRKTKLGYVLPHYIYILRENFTPLEPLPTAVEEVEGISVPTSSEPTASVER
jgi:hypothetical protein